MKFVEAIEKRKSVRTYVDHEIEDDMIQRIKEIFDQASRLYPNSKISIMMSEFCNKSLKAPYYVGIYTDGSEEGMLNAGYVMQQAVIYLTAIGIATCYQGRTNMLRQSDSEGRMLTLALAFGYPNHSMYRNVQEAKRMKLDKLCVFKETPNMDIKKLLHFARLAPSSYNSQPWRFVVYSNRIHVFLNESNFLHVKKYGFINIGVLLANVLVGAEEQWIDIVMKEMDGIKDKTYGNNKYVISIFNRNKDGERI